jgi:hypothetical protein
MARSRIAIKTAKQGYDHQNLTVGLQKYARLRTNGESHPSEGLCDNLLQQRKLNSPVLYYASDESAIT